MSRDLKDLSPPSGAWTAMVLHDLAKIEWLVGQEARSWQERLECGPWPTEGDGYGEELCIVRAERTAHEVRQVMLSLAKLFGFPESQIVQAEKGLRHSFIKEEESR